MKKLLTLACTLSVTPAFASMLIIGVDDVNQPLYAYDTNNMAAAPTAINLGVQAWGMGGDNTNQILYVNSGTTLHAFQYGTWNSLGSVNITNSSGAAQSMVSLGFNNVNGKLYGTKNTATEAVWEIDPFTGIATEVYVYTAASYDFGGLDFDESGVAYGTNDDGTPGPAGLYQLDLVNEPTLVAAYPAGETDIDGLAVGGGKAFLIEDDATATGSIYIYDFNTASYSSIATPWTSSRTFSSGTVIDVVPEPTTMTVLGLGALALLRKRKSK